MESNHLYILYPKYYKIPLKVIEVDFCLTWCFKTLKQESPLSHGLWSYLREGRHCFYLVLTCFAVQCIVCALYLGSHLFLWLSSKAGLLGGTRCFSLSDKRTQALSLWRPKVPIVHMLSHPAVASWPSESLLQVDFRAKLTFGWDPVVTTPDKDSQFFLGAKLLRALILCPNHSSFSETQVTGYFS